MTVGGIHHQHIHAGLCQRHNPRLGVAAGTDSGADTQPPLVILAGQRVVLCLLNVLDGDQPAQLEIVIDHQHFFDAMTVQQLLDVVQASPFFHRDQLILGRHDVLHRSVHPAFKPDVTASDNAQQVTAIDHRQAGNIVRHGDIHQLADGGIRRHGNRVFYHTAFELLDLPNRCCLLLNGHVLVHDANSAFLGHGNGQVCFGNGIHRGRYKRNVQSDTFGQPGLQAHLVGKNF